VKKVGFIGGGNMGFALAKAISAQFSDTQIFVFDPRKERIALFERELPRVRAGSGPEEVVEAAEVIFVAVKPQDIQPVLEAIRDTDRSCPTPPAW
jgi:pyrroline-5-carboxylate reductase